MMPWIYFRIENGAVVMVKEYDEFRYFLDNEEFIEYFLKYYSKAVVTNAFSIEKKN